MKPIPIKLDRCPKDGKPCYDKKAAVTARNKQWKDRHVALRVYECALGNHWHLTSGDPHREERNREMDTHTGFYSK